MSGRISTILVLLLICSTSAIVNATNTTQFDNFTIEWEDFNILNCAIPNTVNISLFTCLPPADYTQVNDVDCLNLTTIDFDQDICLISTTSVMYTSGGSTIITTPQITTVGIQMTTTAPMVTTGVTSAAASITTIGTSVTSISNTTGPHVTSISGATVSTVTSNSNTTVASGTSSSSTTVSTSTSVASISTTSASGTVDIYSCQANAYIGTYCNISSDACAMSQPCQNAATCYPNNTLPLGYLCNCHTGYSGYDCEYDGRACTENTCWHDGTCIPVNTTINTNNGSNFKCECVEGYDGQYCELEIDLCSNITCENRGVCFITNFMWQCVCLDSSLYYGDYCQFKTGKLKLREILSKSFASVAIGAIITTCGFIIIMDVLKYAFHIDPVEHERETYRQRRADRKRARRPIREHGPRFALRFQYVS